MTNDYNRLIGNSPAFMRTLHAARMVASTHAPVMIIGERGTGKEQLAREIHRVGRRRDMPFTMISCAGLTEAQFEKALPDGGVGDGTLFLDEIPELPAASQGRLMHFLETSAESGHDVRVIASTSQDIHGLVESGDFREDLYYRLHVVPLEMPPLRERRDDIVLLLKQLTAELARQHGRKVPAYSVSARNLLKDYAWPGNVRELRNFCERMVVLHGGGKVQPEDVPVEIRRGKGQRMGEGRFVLPEGGIDLASMEGDMIVQALEMAGGNRSKAARLLGLTRDTLLYRIQKHAIQL
ncbi:MAG: sigma 54-interacting transcriptional regulator [Sedimenticola sp.]